MHRQQANSVFQESDLVTTCRAIALARSKTLGCIRRHGIQQKYRIHVNETHIFQFRQLTNVKMTGDLVTKVQKTVGFRSHDFLDTAELFLARLQNASCPDQGSPHAPIAISNDEQSENGSSISSRGCITADDKGDSDQIITDGDVTLPSTEPKDPRKRCLVKGRRYRVFRDGLYKLFAVKKPHVHQLPFAEVLTTVNEGLPAERRFTLLEAKQVLKYMEEKLFDSLCVDRITGVDLRDVELYA
jgi:hypothetical protein